MLKRWGLLATAAFAVLFAALPAQAARYKQYGDYQIHYNAVPTATLQPEIARRYDIVRSRQRALLTVSVLKKGKPVRARVEAEAVNLNDQLRRIAMREIQEGGAVYYIGTFGVDDREKLNFRIQVLPRGETQLRELHFQQQFFTGK